MNTFSDKKKKGVNFYCLLVPTVQTNIKPLQYLPLPYRVTHHTITTSLSLQLLPLWQILFPAMTTAPHDNSKENTRVQYHTLDKDTKTLTPAPSQPCPLSTLPPRQSLVLLPVPLHD